jgi:hypothetical protein
MSELDGRKRREEWAFKLAVVVGLVGVFILSFIWLLP